MLSEDDNGMQSTTAKFRKRNQPARGVQHLDRLARIDDRNPLALKVFRAQRIAVNGPPQPNLGHLDSLQARERRCGWQHVWLEVRTQSLGVLEEQGGADPERANLDAPKGE